MPDRARICMASSLLLLLGLLLTVPSQRVDAAACTGTLSCKNCRNCSHCTHCGKQGGICGACVNHSPVSPKGRLRPGSKLPMPASLLELRSQGSAGYATGRVPVRPDRPGRTAFDFHDRVLSGQKFNDLDLRGADFSGANLRDVVFRGANLERAKFQGAYLGGADFTDCKLRSAELKGAWYNAETRWPRNFDPDVVGARPVE